MPEPPPKSFGPYRVVEELGRGGMGIVYRARRDDLDRDFAVKQVMPGAGSEHDEAALARLQREAQAAAQLADIPGIVGVHDVGEQDGQVYLAMDLVDGRPLDAILLEDDWSHLQAVECIAQVAEALEAAHRRGVLHRDVKPANVLVESPHAALRAHLTDFGLAKWTRAEGELSRLTASGAILGTPAYMAPEQARGESLDARADVYALGVTLYEALAGRPPFDGDTMLAVLHRVLREPPPPLLKARPELPRALAAVVHRAMAKEPDRRYPSAAAFAADLRRFLAGEPVEARLPGPLARLGSALRRRRRLALAAGGAVLVAVAALVAVPLLRERQDDATRKLQGAKAEAAEADRLGEALAAYRDLVQQTLPAMQRLEDVWRNVRVSEAERTAALARVDAAAEAVAEQRPGTLAPAAWRALAHGFASEVEALQTLRDLGRDARNDPIPALLLAQILLARYGAEAQLPEIAMSTAEQVVGDYRETPSQQDWRVQALAALQQVRDLPGWSSLDEAARYAALARGTEALAAGRYAVAAEAFAAVRDDPLLGATASDLQGLSLFAAGEFRESAAAWERAAERGWPAGLANAANAWISEGIERNLADRPAAEPYERAIGLLGRALAIVDQPAPVLRARASARTFLADVVPRLEGGTPAQVESLLNEAVADFRRSLASEPSDSSAAALGQGLMKLAQHHRRTGRDPRPLLAQAEAALTAAIEHAPEQWVPWLNRATVRRRQAELLGPSGDAEPLFASSLDDLRQAATLRVPPYPVYLEIAFTQLSLGRVRMRFTTADPEPPLRAAIEACTRALEARPGAVQALQARGGAAEALGRLMLRRRADGDAHFQAAEVDLTEAIERAPGDASLWRDRGVVRYRRAALGSRALPDHLAALAAARADYEQAVERGMRHSGIYLNLANVRLAEGDALRRAGQDPTAAWDGAEQEYTKALELNERDGALWLMRARLRQARAGHAQRQRRDPEPWLAGALADYGEAITRMPRSADAWGQHGRLLAASGRLAEAEQSLAQAAALSGGTGGWAELLARVRRDRAAGK